MNRSSDIDRTLQVWMTDGPTAISDRVVDVVAARIGAQRQRRAWPFQRRAFVNTQIKLIAALAAVLVVAVVGYNLLPREQGSGGTPQSPMVTAPSTPSPSAVAIQDVSDRGGPLDPGRWRFQPFESGPSVVADVPAGWTALETQLGLENVRATNSPPSGIAIVFSQSEQGLFSDPCRWDVDGTGTFEQDGDVEVGPDVADLVGALRANTSYQTSTPSPVAFGPYEGEQVELRLPAGLDPATCDQATDESEGRYRILPDTIYAQGPDNIWRMFIVDVAGTRFIATIEYFPGTAAEDLAAAQAIVDSFELTP